MQFNNILFTIENEIAIIELNTPNNLNAFNEIMIQDVSQALTVAEQDESVKVIVMKANGKAFSGGGDLAAMAEGIKNDHSIYDMYYAVLARRNDALLITNDGPLANVCKKLNIKVCN